ncbi:hypothetical protein DXN05_06630 [Deminuibacter soli]|uniref:Uncharacterized protein n=1 Tax=Deminuibacter soli TaxID=2291815 RepID=A0A3E1NMJ5_9BACT|nr:hypothetical protein DXN05_06630 [Deminuibacter soli]
MASQLLTGCYTYRISTKAQEGTEIQTRHVNAYFWGLVQSPKAITTPVCDSLNARGMAIVQMKTNLGYSLLTVATLGIWCPMTVQYKCSKPCPLTGPL